VCAQAGATRDDIAQFSTYRRDLESDSDLFNAAKIWEVARATSAASTFFEPIEIGPNHQKFYDGGTIANNPIRQLWTEADDIWGLAPGDSGISLSEQVQCLVSIGTGVPTVESFGTTLWQVGETILKMATETELTADQFMKDRGKDLEIPRRYFRFNVTHGLENVGLEEADKREVIAGMTARYGRLGSTRAELRLFRTAAKVGAQGSQGG
jgi:predicted acylesterase/phospholipase RssA